MNHAAHTAIKWGSRTQFARYPLFIDDASRFFLFKSHILLYLKKVWNISMRKKTRLQKTQLNHMFSLLALKTQLKAAHAQLIKTIRLSVLLPFRGNASISKEPVDKIL